MRCFDYDKVKDPRFFSENRLPAHSDHKFFASEEEAHEGSSSFVCSLNGLWKFSYAKNYRSAVKGSLHHRNAETRWEYAGRR